MKRLSLNIIGAGHLGKSIAALLVKNKLIQVGSVCNRTKASTLSAIAFIGQGSYCAEIKQLPRADLTLVSVPDDRIADCCEQLADNKTLGAGEIVFHCSGALSSEILSPLKARKVFVASVHPMSSFADPQLSVSQYQNIYCALEGDQEALACLDPLFRGIGSKTFPLKKEKKTLYHAAGVFASNYLVTLAHQSYLCLDEAGVGEEQALQMILGIMRGTLDNIESLSSFDKALTGPIQRADRETLARHMSVLKDKPQEKIYTALGQATLPLTDHDTMTLEALVQSMIS